MLQVGGMGIPSLERSAATKKAGKSTKMEGCNANIWDIEVSGGVLQIFHDISLGWSVCCILLCGFYLRGKSMYDRSPGWKGGGERRCPDNMDVTDWGRSRPWRCDRSHGMMVYNGLYMFINIYIRGIILIISPQGSGSWIIIIYLECYGVVPPIWFPCRVFFSPIVWCIPILDQFCSSKKVPFWSPLQWSNVAMENYGFEVYICKRGMFFCHVWLHVGTLLHALAWGIIWQSFFQFLR